MLDSYMIFLLMILVSSIIMGAIIIYKCLIWHYNIHQLLKLVSNKGLSPLELEKLPKIAGKELAALTECAICLDEIDNEQQARLVPSCNHAFHLQCADRWLSKHANCPLCRTKLKPQALNSESLC